MLVAPAVLAFALALQTSPPPKPDAATAVQLFNAGRLRDAEAMADVLARATPSDGTLWSLLGNTRFAQKHYRTAADAFRRACEVLPKDRTVRDNLGVCLYSLQDLDAARATFEESVKIDPGSGRAHLFLARIAAQRDDAETAEREFQLAVNAPTADALAPFYYGLHLFQDRRLEESERHFEHALRLDPDFAGAHMNLALVLQRRGEAARSEVHMRRFRDLTEAVHSEDRVRLRVGALLRDVQREFEAANLDAAIALAEEAVREAPQLPLVHNTLGRLYQMRGRHDDAKREMELAQKLAAEQSR